MYRSSNRLNTLNLNNKKLASDNFNLSALTSGSKIQACKISLLILSSDKFIVDKNEKETLKKKFNGIAIDMESASINHVAYLNNKEFVTLRIISDSGNNIEYR